MAQRPLATGSSTGPVSAQTAGAAVGAFASGSRAHAPGRYPCVGTSGQQLFTRPDGSGQLAAHPAPAECAVGERKQQQCLALAGHEGGRARSLALAPESSRFGLESETLDRSAVMPAGIICQGQGCSKPVRKCFQTGTRPTRGFHGVQRGQWHQLFGRQHGPHHGHGIPAQVRLCGPGPAVRGCLFLFEQWRQPTQPERPDTANRPTRCAAAGQLPLRRHTPAEFAGGTACAGKRHDHQRPGHRESHRLGPQPA